MIRRRLQCRRFAYACLASLLAGAAMATPSPRSPIVIPLGMYLGVVPSLQVESAGHKTTFLLDTAGGLTMLTPAFAQAVSCRPWGQLTGFRMRGDRVDVPRCDRLQLSAQGAALDLRTAGVWDFSKLLPRNAPSLGGSLALDAFAGKVVTLDLAAGQLVIETPTSLKARVRHATEIPVRFEREVGGRALVPLVALDTPKGRLWLELDCGSDGALIINRPAAAALGLAVDGKNTQLLDTTLEGGIPLKARAQVENLIIDGNIGAPLLRHWIVTLDLARQRLWIATR